MIYFAEDYDLETLIHAVVGASSMCWTDVANAGVFDSDKAIRIANEAIQKIREMQLGPELTEFYT